MSKIKYFATHTHLNPCRSLSEYLDAQQKKAQAPQNPFEASSSNGASRPRAPPPPMADMPGSSRRGAKDEPRAGGLSGQAGDAFNGPNGANEGLGDLGMQQASIQAAFIGPDMANEGPGVDQGWCVPCKRLSWTCQAGNAFDWPHWGG
eukprot:1160205-Pelagomonas_calceolata.AAC.8